MWFLLVPFATAGDLSVTTPPNVRVFIDGAVARRHGPGEFYASSLRGGMHRVEVHLGRRIVGELNLEVLSDARTRVEWSTRTSNPGFTVWAPEFRTRPTARPQPRPRPPTRPQRPPAGPQPISPSGMSALLSSLHNASFDRDKLAILDSARARQFFLTSQLSQILETFSFDNHRKDAACMLASKVLDPENAFRLSTAFDFSHNGQSALACF